MKKIFSIILAILSLNLFAQITVDESHISDIGDIVYQYNESPTSNSSVGSSGTNQNWDFSGLNIGNHNNMLLFINPTGAPHEAQYPNANLCLKNGGAYSYYNKTNSGLFLHGIGDTVFNSPALYLPLPLTYGLSLSDGPIVVIENFVYGPFLSGYIPDSLVSVLTNGLANTADTALIKITNTTDFLVDAWGSMTTDLGTFDVLRLKITTYTDSELDVYCSDTVTQIGSWITNIPFSSIPALGSFSNNSVEYKYQWITDDNTVSFLICEAAVDANDNIDNWSFQTSPPPSSVVESTYDMFNVYPNPSKEMLNIQILESKESVFSFIDVNGKVLFEKLSNSSFILDVSRYSKGIYYLKKRTNNNVIVRKVIIK